MLIPGNKVPPIFGVFGLGRGGTTWLGSILNSHPELTYRFEPTHRLLHHARIQEIFDSLQSEIGNSEEIIYRNLLPLHPALDRPPFFKNDPLRTAIRKKLWMLSRAFQMIAPLYEALYTPRFGTPLVFKEVTREPYMRMLLERTTIKIVYIVRSPWAVVASNLRGQADGRMPTGRFSVLENLLRMHDNYLASAYAGRIQGLSDVQKNALLWRMDVEKGLDAIAGKPNGKLVIYENLCRAPLAEARRIFDHFQVEFHEDTERFIIASTSGNRAVRRRLGEGSVKEYFSVFHDPIESMNRWRSQLSSSQTNEISDVVSQSKAFQECAAMGNWHQ